MESVGIASDLETIKAKLEAIKTKFARLDDTSAESEMIAFKISELTQLIDESIALSKIKECLPF